MRVTDYDIFCGIDVAKKRHYLMALRGDGKRVLARGVDNDERELRAIFGQLTELGRVIVVVDQVSGIGVLPLAVARDMQLDTRYLPGLTMRRLADLYPGTDKTDPRDAFIIADGARTLPHTLRPVGRVDTMRAETAVLTGFDDDLTRESVRLTNQLRDAMLHVHAGLERLLGDRLRYAVLHLLTVASTPAALRKLGEDGVREVLGEVCKRTAKYLTGDIMRVLDEQTVEVPGTAEFGRVISWLARRLSEVDCERAEVRAELGIKLDNEPTFEIIRSLPGVGTNSAARLLVAIGDGSHFPTAGHLASYAGLAPTTRQSGTSIAIQRQQRRGNIGLKALLFSLAMTAILHDPRSKEYYQRKRAEGKRHNGAAIALARRRLDLIHAMLKTKTHYRAPVTTQVVGEALSEVVSGLEHRVDATGV